VTDSALQSPPTVQHHNITPPQLPQHARPPPQTPWGAFWRGGRIGRRRKQEKEGVLVLVVAS
jgi:hypothetical protein